MSDPITFFATFPERARAVSSGVDYARLLLDIPATESAAVGALSSLMLGSAGVLLRVTVEVVEQPVIGQRVKESLGDGSSEVNRRTARRPTDVARG